MNTFLDHAKPLNEPQSLKIWSWPYPMSRMGFIFFACGRFHGTEALTAAGDAWGACLPKTSLFPYSDGSDTELSGTNPAWVALSHHT